MRRGKNERARDANASMTTTSAPRSNRDGRPSGRTRLSVLSEPGTVDLARAERAAAALLEALGVDLSGESRRETPRRVAAMYADLLSPVPFDAKTFPNDERYDELVVARSISFHSLREHHLLPFFGVAHVGYLPGERIVGLSKLARAIDFFARDLQVQERLTSQVASWLERALAPKGVGVVLEAEHMCMSLRGVRSPALAP